MQRFVRARVNGAQVSALHNLTHTQQDLPSRAAVMLSRTACSLLRTSCLFSRSHPPFSFPNPSSPCFPLFPSPLTSKGPPQQPFKHRSFSRIPAFASGPLHWCLVPLICIPAKPRFRSLRSVTDIKEKLSTSLTQQKLKINRARRAIGKKWSFPLSKVVFF